MCWSCKERGMNMVFSEADVQIAWQCGRCFSMIPIPLYCVNCAGKHYAGEVCHIKPKKKG